VCTSEEVTQATHKHITKAAEIGPILHFFCEWIRDIAFAGDVFDSNGAICNPFVSVVLTIFDVAIAFGGHDMTPFNAGIVIIVKDCGTCGIIDWVPQGWKMGDHVASVNSQSWPHVCPTDFCFAGAQWCTILAIGFPANWASRAHYDGTAHTPEFKEG
jgi:hypothetical protein